MLEAELLSSPLVDSFFGYCSNCVKLENLEVLEVSTPAKRISDAAAGDSAGL